jgi:hypothetical protein
MGLANRACRKADVCRIDKSKDLDGNVIKSCVMKETTTTVTATISDTTTTTVATAPTSCVFTRFIGK